MKYIDIEINNFSLQNTFENGQCFRWNSAQCGSYIGVVGGKVFEIKNIADSVFRVYNAREEERPFLENYFDVKNNYTEIEYYLYNYDDILKKSVLYGKGMRLLKQDKWETILSFILSIQKNIPAIKKTIEYLCMLYGEKLSYNGGVYYTFPAPNVLKDADIENIMQSSCGFRAKSVLDAARKIYSKEVDIDCLDSLSDEDARAQLKKICGIGNKVADCILLFSLSRYSCCPVDTWVKAGFDFFYGVNRCADTEYSGFADEKFGDKTVFAQQYLFHYLRNNYIQDKNNKKLIKREKNGVYKSMA
jgi:N-glycosylase/DNA lyase